MHVSERERQGEGERENWKGNGAEKYWHITVANSCYIQSCIYMYLFVKGNQSFVR